MSDDSEQHGQSLPNGPGGPLPVNPTLGSQGAPTGRHLPLFQWSNPSLKDHLALFTHGVAGQWTVPRATGQDYFDQMSAEVREERTDSRGRVKVVWVQKRRDIGAGQK